VILLSGVVRPGLGVMSGDGDGKEAETWKVGILPGSCTDDIALRASTTPDSRTAGRMMNSAMTQNGCCLYWSGMIFMGTS
jgi:hypothetical protein